MTITLRKGVRWSDGHPLTAADFAFDLEHIELNTDLTPVVLPLFKGARIEVHGPHRFSYHFPTPRPLLLKYMAHSGERLLAPAHFLERYHPAFTDTAQLEREAVELGLQDWRKYFEVVNNIHDLKVFHRPVFSAFAVVGKTSTRSRYRRNPYYFKVDPEGNQLPYIDFLEVQKVDSKEIMAAKASTGQVTVAGRQLMTADIPLFKRYEEENGYTTYIWPRCYGSDVVFQLNVTHPDERLRRIFADARFRRAMSLAIDRGEINDILYFGQAVPRQLTVVPSSEYFEPASPRPGRPTTRRGRRPCSPRPGFATATATATARGRTASRCKSLSSTASARPPSRTPSSWRSPTGARRASASAASRSAAPCWRSGQRPGSWT